MLRYHFSHHFSHHQSSVHNTPAQQVFSSMSQPQSPREILASYVPLPELQAITEAASSRISFIPQDITDPRLRAARPSRPPPSAYLPPTDEEIEAALADARESDPSGQNDDFYYQGYQSREDVMAVSVAPIVGQAALTRAQDEGYDGEPRMYYHSADNTWRLFPPTFAFPEVSDDEDDEKATGTIPRERKRDKLKKLGVKIFKRVSSLRRKNRRG